MSSSPSSSLSSPKSIDPFPQPETFTIHSIIGNHIPNLQKVLATAKTTFSQTFPPPPPPPAAGNFVPTTTTPPENNSGGTGVSTGNGNGSNTHSPPPPPANLTLCNQLEKLQRDLVYVRDALSKLRALEATVCGQFRTLDQQGEGLEKFLTTTMARARHGPLPTQQIQAQIRLLSEIVLKLKIQIPSPHKMSAADGETHRSHAVNLLDALYLFDGLPNLHKDEKFMGCPAFREIQGIYYGLEDQSKLCLLCFAVFPENVVLKKRLLTHWWFGEGLVDHLDGTPNTPGKKTANEILKDFVVKGFIEPVLKKGVLVGFKMHSLIRSVVVILAEKAGFFDFDAEGKLAASFAASQRACLVKTEEGYSRQELMSRADLDPEKVQILFNVDDPYPDFDLEWFSKMRNVNVLYLGRWQNLVKHHIEVEDTEFLRGLNNMKHLKFFSLQGISRIMVLPSSVCKLINLMVLDLNACHNLESLPSKIGSLKKLIYLDISECYLLDRMPKGLASLSELQVLKGFVISDLNRASSCTLADLANLQKLRKLSINTSKKNFPTDDELIALRGLKALRKLTIAWGGKSLQPKEIPSPRNVLNRLVRQNALSRQSREASVVNPELPPQLEKLDLQCFPGTIAPKWLKPGQLKDLKKLYIRGGDLCNLSSPSQLQGDINEWKNVKILRLKYLSELKMDWKELQESFPSLVYLEKVECPKLTFFPCDGRGVWLNRTVESHEHLQEVKSDITWSFLK